MYKSYKMSVLFCSEDSAGPVVHHTYRPVRSGPTRSGHVINENFFNLDGPKQFLHDLVTLCTFPVLKNIAHKRFSTKFYKIDKLT